MASQSGLEGRYLSRFSKIKEQTGKSLRNYDSAGNLAEHLTTARAGLTAQEKNTKALFATAQEMIAGIDTSQQMFGHTFVKNMPMPSAAIKNSPSQQLGYVQLSMRFLQAGVVHFMEQMVDATEQIERLESLLEKLALYDEEVNFQGELQSLDLDQLETTDHALLPKTSDVTQDPSKPLTPPASPLIEKDNKHQKKETKSLSTASSKKK